ncbi:hypothetical protein CHUAL_005494 [Chamberlinius hualienensis]
MGMGRRCSEEMISLIDNTIRKCVNNSIAADSNVGDRHNSAGRDKSKEEDPITTKAAEPTTKKATEPTTTTKTTEPTTTKATELQLRNPPILQLQKRLNQQL